MAGTVRIKADVLTGRIFMMAGTVRIKADVLTCRTFVTCCDSARYIKLKKDLSRQDSFKHREIFCPHDCFKHREAFPHDCFETEGNHISPRLFEKGQMVIFVEITHWAL